MTADRLFFGAFTVERRFGARPERVFRAFADREMKQRWMGCEEVAAPVIERLDFHVEGRAPDHPAVKHSRVPYIV